MKNIICIIFFLLININKCISQRVIDVPFINDEKIKLDGFLDEKEWEDSKKLSLDYETISQLILLGK